MNNKWGALGLPGWWHKIRADIKDLDMHMSEYKEDGEIGVTRRAIWVAIIKADNILAQLEKAYREASL